MFLVSSNKARSLLVMNYAGRVERAELRRGLDDLKVLLPELSPGFRVLADFSTLEAMAIDCATEIGLAMDMMDERGVGLIVRVMPDVSKDIGLNILSAFHYDQRPRVVTCGTLGEAARALEL